MPLAREQFDARLLVECVAGDAFRVPMLKPAIVAVEGNLRAMGQSTIENDSPVEAKPFVTKLLGEETERGRFELP